MTFNYKISDQHLAYKHDLTIRVGKYIIIICWKPLKRYPYSLTKYIDYSFGRL